MTRLFLRPSLLLPLPLLLLLLLPVVVVGAATGRPAEGAAEALAPWSPANGQMGPFAPWSKAGRNPVMAPRPDTAFFCPLAQRQIHWEEKDVFNPAAVTLDGAVKLLYRAEDKVGSLAGTSRIGLATSVDGESFDRLPEPVLYPMDDALRQNEWDGGCEDPRVVRREEDGRFFMTYTTYDGTARLAVASSDDLVHWEKHGMAFSGVLGSLWTKAGAVVTRLDGSDPPQLVAAKINGLYHMYWGEHHIRLATSEDLVRWTPVVDPQGEAYRGRPEHAGTPLKEGAPGKVLSPRDGKFDSELVEPGPPAVLLPELGGILLLYNGKNAGRRGDKALPVGTYASGQAIFALDDPSRLLWRSDEPFLQPSEPFEITGQVGNVIFIQGLVFFEGRWLLYYGTADSKIGMASYSPPSPSPGSPSPSPGSPVVAAEAAAVAAETEAAEKRRREELAGIQQRLRAAQEAEGRASKRLRSGPRGVITVDPVPSSQVRQGEPEADSPVALAVPAFLALAVFAACVWSRPRSEQKLN